jgi:hypothetical protein
MKKAIWLAVALLTGTQVWSQDQDFRNYVEKYKDIAVREMERARYSRQYQTGAGFAGIKRGKKPPGPPCQQPFWY